MRLLTGGGWLAAIAFATAIFSPNEIDAGQLRAAADKADLTPAKSQLLWGYSDRKGPSEGTRDPLYGKVLLLDDGRRRLALVTLDLGRTFGVESMNVVRDRVHKSANVNDVFFFASHTHSGPVIDETYPPGKRPEWESAALDRLAAAIERAAANLTPAQLGTGEGETLIGHNRRLILPDGKVKMLWRNATKIPTHPVDSRVAILRVDDTQGHALAVLVNYQCHPVVFGPDNLKYSADYPSAMAEVVEKGLPGSVCLFLQGAAGNINPYFDKMRLDEDAIVLMTQTGKQLGEEALRVAKGIVSKPAAHPELQFSRDVRNFRFRYDTAKLMAGLKAQLRPEIFDRYRKYLLTPLDCPITTLLVNREIALMGMPGEPFVEFGVDFRDRSPATFSLFAGYANGYHGYFPTIRAAVEGGYGAEGVVSRIEVGAGEQMVDAGIIRLYQMLGQLKPVPSH